MIEELKLQMPKARKDHTCDYCGKIISKGTVYDRAVLKFDYIYEWKNHVECGFIASALWNFIDPDEGMRTEDFQEGCQLYCERFVCPHCDKYDKEIEGCSEDEVVCYDKVYERLKTHPLKHVHDNCRNYFTE
jgi:hypothetical protein